jgi:hypothetical protein
LLEDNPLIPIDVRFQLDRSEFLTAHRTYLGRSLLSFRTLGLMTLALSLGALQAQLFGGKELALRVFGGLWVALMGFVAWAYLGLPIRTFRERPELGAEQRIQVDGDGLTHSRGETAGEFIPWDGIDGLFEKNGFLFFTRKNRLPIVLPLRSFATEEQRDQARELCARGFYRTESK